MYAIEYFDVFGEFVSSCEDFIYFLFYKNTSGATAHITISFLKPFVLTSSGYLVLHVLQIPYCVTILMLKRTLVRPIFESIQPCHCQVKKNLY